MNTMPRIVVGLTLTVASLGLLLTLAGTGIDGAGGTPATGVTVGGFHTCAVTVSGGAQCWGLNNYGQLGDGTSVDSSTPVDVVGLGGGVVGITAGGHHTCALISGGGAKCWGRNSFGQLGDGTTTSSSVPVDVTGLSAVAVSAGGFHTCAVTAAGGAKCWGKNNSGGLGDGTTSDRSTPVDVSGLTGGVTAIAAGGGDSQGAHTCARTDAGGLKCWGRNNFGQLGDGSSSGRLQPVDVSGLTAGVAGIATGRYHTCAVSTAGGAKCWGWNIGGQLGDGTHTTRLSPADVSGLDSGVAQVSAGGTHTCAAMSDGGARCWGFNTSGQLGNGVSGTSSNTPQTVLAGPGEPLAGVALAAAGGNISSDGHSCALTASGGVKCWGLNTTGQAGNGTTLSVSHPVDVTGFDPKPAPTATPSETPSVIPSETPNSTPWNEPTATHTSTSTPTWTPEPPAPTPSPDGAPEPTLEEQLDGLVGVIEDLDLPPGAKESLKAKLERVSRHLAAGRWCTAANVLGAFIHQVEALERSGRISEAEAQDLISQAQRMVSDLEASPCGPDASRRVPSREGRR